MTFEREIMGFVALAVVWINTGLICAHALNELGQRLRLRRRLAPAVPGGVGLVCGVIEAGTTADLPELALTLVGRSRGDGSLYFHDRSAQCAAGNFRVIQENGSVLDVARPEPASLWVWPQKRRIQEETRCTSVEEFDAVLPQATYARGAERVHRFITPAGTPVFVAGRLGADGVTLEPGVIPGLILPDVTQDPSAPILLVSEEDPRRVLSRQVALLAVVTVVMGVALLLLTALTLTPPAFGTVSKVGAFALLVFLLLVQPIGVWLTERILPPHRALYGGVWRRQGLPSLGDAASRDADPLEPLEPSPGKTASA